MIVHPATKAMGSEVGDSLGIRIDLNPCQSDVTVLFVFKENIVSILPLHYSENSPWC